MQIERLRLVGFKSFADAAEAAIGPGLTAIVGPNGCGKSNLAEALRWVMGESSARRLRGGAMDDVIFGGTAARAARNLAEVSLTIDNSARDAPSGFNNRDAIEIVRRIERGAGSAWRVNGHEARARDIQLLFADVGSGAASGAIVGQGRVAALIEAKPADRRLLLEEAAGTAGVQARRRETEQRLAAATENVARLDDVSATLREQLDALKKQARRAQRYRQLGEQIRRQEAVLFLARLRSVEAEADARAGDLTAAGQAAAETAEHAAAAGQARDDVETTLSVLRHAASETAAELQRLTARRAGLEQELARCLAAQRDAERRLAETSRDQAREEGLIGEADAVLRRLADERRALSEMSRADGPARDAAEARLRAAALRLDETESVLQRATEDAAGAQAERRALERGLREMAERRMRTEADLAEAEHRRVTSAGALVAPAARAAAATVLARAEKNLALCRAADDAARTALTARQQDEIIAHDAARQSAAKLDRLEAEADALAAVTAPAADRAVAARLVAALRVAEGFEAAIGALFADELEAALGDDSGSDGNWFALPEIAAPALPSGARSFAGVVGAPPALARSLAFAGWIDDGGNGRDLQPELVPGQRLVDRDGRLWRWDGFTRGPGGSAAAAQHLRHRNRLETLADEISAARDTVSAAEDEAAAAATAYRGAVEAERLAGGRLRDAEASLARARAADAELAAAAASAEARLRTAADTAARLADDAAAARVASEEAARGLAALPEAATTTAALNAARDAAAEARRTEADARAALDRIARDAKSLGDRMAAIDREESAWRKRRAEAAAQRTSLDGRRNALEREIAALAARPAAIAAASETLGGEIAAAARGAGEAADRLAAGETRLREATEGWRSAERAASEARERRARLEGQAAAAVDAVAALTREIRERVGCEPDEIERLAGLAAGETLPDPAASAQHLDRLTRERNAIGPVNLMAESEAAEFGARVAALDSERADLGAAIAKLHRAAQALDRQGRELLAAAFERINRHFEMLFTRLFGGGKAQLALTDDGDPLTAGLEIMASPTGKRLQTLTLLSGGEQALTALALLFAVFLTRPAPICVLDEVDAPLDDANVERLCGLVSEIAEETGTRFLLITHHRITMARADRLFGVTMAEPGISQLVSVDLSRAVGLRQTA